MASFNEDPADRAAELERMLVGHECTLETAFGFYTLGDCRYAIGDYKGAHEAWKTLHEANITNALTDQALFQDGRALDASGDLLGAVHALSLIHISEPTRRTPISYAVFCLKKKMSCNASGSSE